MRTEIGTIVAFFPSKENKNEWIGYIRLDKPMWDVFFKFNPESSKRIFKPIFNEDSRQPECGDKVVVTWAWKSIGGSMGAYAKIWGYLEDWKRIYKNIFDAIMNIPFFVPSKELESILSDK